MPHDIKDASWVPDLWINREWSWLAFNQRVLMEALREENPVFERMKFLAIVSSNLDEFFMVRVASLRDQCNAGFKRPDAGGSTPKQQLARIMPRMQRMITEQHRIYRQRIAPDLADCGVRFVPYEALVGERALWADRYFQREVFPILTPMAADDNRPFPHILNRSLNIAVLLAARQGDKPDFATVQVPSALPRAIRLPQAEGAAQGERCDFLMLEDLIIAGMRRLFAGRQVLCSAPYRVTRSGDFPIDEEEGESILLEVEKSVKKRKWGAVTRLEIAYDADDRIARILRHALQATREEVYRIHGPINLDFLMKQVYSLPGFAAHRYRPFTPCLPAPLDAPGGLFDAIAQRDWLLHHPYDSFDSVVRLVQDAARDASVMAIKQTLYRVSGQSPIMRALVEAAEAGKQVTVMLEVKARFDEENNIQWGRRLERAGCHVVYGLKGLKTHAKIILIVRREALGIRRYVHLSTGNYNDVTANLYTDIGLLTADPALGEDATEFFNMLTGYSDAPALGKLIYAPVFLRRAFLERIRREADNARLGLPAGITAKCNALLDEEVAAALCEASRAGVPIRLLVRGICCLRPGVPDHSQGIQVRSIVGRFLEHSRIYHFVNGGAEELFLSSADWMTRNLDRRVELLFPVEDAAVRARVLDILERSWRDDAQAWVLGEDGKYHRAQCPPGSIPFNVQEALVDEARAASAR
ncbi:MAG: polyphosphate kinase 1 [Oscillospiraceae bacterium]|jgi:polyphosphate kinase|nr:polyphosphate kinase 1 [Oscillospiraceae bacterium]